jgi:hypothetical protein
MQMLVDGVLNVYYNTKRWRIKMKKEIKKAAEELKGKIEKIAEKLDKFPEPELTINISGLKSETFKCDIKRKDLEQTNLGLNNLYNELAKMNKDGVIYVITADNLPDDIKGKYEELKENEKDDQSMSRIINEHWGDISKPDQCLYVGSSHDIKNRIKQHLGIDLKKGENYISKTYALYMSTWLVEKSVKIKIDIYNFKADDKEIPNYLQIVEDLMWECYKPLFGKKGAK